MKSVSSVFSNGGHRFTIDLVDEFLAHRTYQHAFCLKLFELGKNPSASWDVRRLATLMAEHQILKLGPDQLDEFDGVFRELRLKRPGIQNPIAASVLRESYSTTEFRLFCAEFLRRLARNDRVHRRIDAACGSRKAAREDAVGEFIEHSRRDCRLTLARYLFTPDDVIREVLRHLTVTDGVRDVDVSQPRFIDAEIKHHLAMLPEYEAGILQRLCAGSKVYWVADGTSATINSLVEYPLSTVVLVIKPPGSDLEFELKRAGRKGSNALSVVFKRNGRNVPSSHRLDGGSMQWLLRYEARSGSKISSIFRLVHRVDAPVPGYIARNTVYAIPTRNGAPMAAAPAFRYFTEPHVFGNGAFREMRSAMKEAVKVYERDEGENLPAVGGDMGMTAEFLSHVAPAQSILCGTSSFRVDKVATYLSSEGAEKYFKEYQGIAYSADDARRFADELLDEVLGVYAPPTGAFRSYGRYVDRALAVPVNRERANRIFLSLVRQIAEFWGTVMGIRGQSRGESFVGRNVGIRSVWVGAQWRVRLIFMDHDALTLPDDEIGHFFAQNALPGMLLDERHIWGKANPALFPTSLVGYLIGIYRIDRALEVQAQCIAETELRAAYKKTQHAVLTDRKLRAFVSDVFVSRLLDWDLFVSGYLNRERGWETRMKRIFKSKGYEPDAFDYYTEACHKYRGFLERNAFLYVQ